MDNRYGSVGINLNADVILGHFLGTTATAIMPDRQSTIKKRSRQREHLPGAFCPPF